MEQNYKLMYAQKSIEAMEYDLALDEAVKSIALNMVSPEDGEFESTCREIKTYLLREARKTMKTVLKDVMKEQQGEEYERQ